MILKSFRRQIDIWYNTCPMSCMALCTIELCNYDTLNYRELTQCHDSIILSRNLYNTICHYALGIVLLTHTS